MVVNLNIPEKTAVTQLCPVIDATAENCRGVQYTAQVAGDMARQLCAAEAQGTLSTLLDSGMRSALMPDSTFASNVTQVLMLHYSVSGCSALAAADAAAAGNRRALKQQAGGGTGQLVVVITDLLLNIANGQTLTYGERAQQYIAFFSNATIIRQLMGGSAVLLDGSVLGGLPPYTIGPDGHLIYPNGTYIVNTTLYYGNVTNNGKNYSVIYLDANRSLSDSLNQIGIHPSQNNNDMFIFDRLPPPPSTTPPPSGTTLKKSSASRRMRDAGAALVINSLLALSGVFMLLGAL